MISAQEVHHNVKRKLNRINSNFSQYVSVSEVDEYLKEALGVWMNNKAFKAEANSEVRNDIRHLEIKDFKLDFENRPDKVVAKLPGNFLKRLRQYAIGSRECISKDCEDCKNRKISINIVRSGNLNTLLEDPYWDPSFIWAETLGDEATDGLHIWHNKKFKIDSVFIDYIRKPLEVRCPSLTSSGYYTVGDKTYSTDQGLELDQKYQINEITDLACLFIMRDLSDGQEYQLQADKILRTITTYLN